MHCVNHPETAGIGVCVECRRVICRSCSTRLQGRNFCVDCIVSRKEQAREDAESRSGLADASWILLAAASAMALTAVFSALGFLLYLAG